jgi:hypothetical protein
MAHIFADSPGKQAVREKWNTPFNSLTQQLRFTFRYYGLPGPDIIDILFGNT